MIALDIDGLLTIISLTVLVVTIIGLSIRDWLLARRARGE